MNVQSCRVYTGTEFQSMFLVDTKGGSFLVEKRKPAIENRKEDFEYLEGNLIKCWQ